MLGKLSALRNSDNETLKRIALTIQPCLLDPTLSYKALLKIMNILLSEIDETFDGEFNLDMVFREGYESGYRDGFIGSFHTGDEYYTEEEC